MLVIHKSYDELFSLNNLLRSWRKFRRGKASKQDVMNFEFNLEDNLFGLNRDLRGHVYQHSAYAHFQIFDNKKRDIYKAEVSDRVVHQIVYDYLLSIFEPQFISDSYASRVGRGQYKAIAAFRYFIKLVMGNKNNDCYVLKGDVRKYFDSVDHKVLLSLIKGKITDRWVLAVIAAIVSSHEVTSGSNRGIPLGNITSQIFANIYLDQLDQYIKKDLKCRFYVRYNDDLVIVSESRQKLNELRAKIVQFAKDKLLLEIPLEKTSIRKIFRGVDFLGFIVLPKAALLRNKTKGKIYSNLNSSNRHSYLGILRHCNSYNLRQKILSIEEMKEIC